MISYCELDNLVSWEFNTDYWTFEEIFLEFEESKRLIAHLWEKFKQYNSSLTTLFAHADEETGKLILEVINKVMK
jgi:glutathionylspermidine synthase